MAKKKVGKKVGKGKTTTRKGPTSDPSERAAQGGKARAEALSPERKKKIAKLAALARWRDKPIKAEHDGVIRLGAAEIPCANLPDGRRVLSEAAIMTAIGRGYSGYYSKRDAAAETKGVTSHRSLSPAVLQPFVPAVLAEMLAQPVAYQGTKNPVVAKGIPAEALPMIFDVWIKARDEGVLTPRQVQTANLCEVLRRALAATGIVAMIDEATGAQYARARFALARYLEQYVSKELAAWEKIFPDAYFKAIFRLRGWSEERFQRRPAIVGKWTRDLIYQRLGPGILQRLEEIVPRDEKGRLKFKLHQGLTRDKGVIALEKHIAAVTMLAQVTYDVGESWSWFIERMDQRLPKVDGQLTLRFMKEGPDDEPSDA